MSTKIDGNRSAPLSSSFEPTCEVKPAQVNPQAKPPEEEPSGLIDSFVEGLERGKSFMDEVGGELIHKGAQQLEVASKSVRSLMDEGVELKQEVTSAAQEQVHARHEQIKDTLLDTAQTLTAFKDLTKQEIERRVDDVGVALNSLKSQAYDGLNEKLEMGQALGQQVESNMREGIDAMREELSTLDPERWLPTLMEAADPGPLNPPSLAQLARGGVEVVIAGAQGIKDIDQALDLNRRLPESIQGAPFVRALHPLGILEQMPFVGPLVPALVEGVLTHHEDLRMLANVADPGFHAAKIRDLRPGEEHQLLIKGGLSVGAGVAGSAGAGFQAQVSRDFEDKYEAKLTFTGGGAVGLGAGAQDTKLSVEVGRETQIVLAFEGKGDKAKEAIARLITAEGSMIDALQDPFIQEHLSFKQLSNKQAASLNMGSGPASMKGALAGEAVINGKEDGLAGQINLSASAELALSSPLQLSGAKASERWMNQLESTELGTFLAESGALDSLRVSPAWQSMDLILGTNSVPEVKAQGDVTLQFEDRALTLNTKTTIELGSHTFELVTEHKAKDMDALMAKLDIGPKEFTALTPNGLLELCKQRQIKHEEHFEFKQTIKLVEFTGPGAKVFGVEGSSKSSQVIYASTKSERGQEPTVHKDDVDAHFSLNRAPKELRAADLYHHQIRG